MELSLSALMEKNRTFIPVSKPKMNEHNVGLILVGVSRTLIQILQSIHSSTLCWYYISHLFAGLETFIQEYIDQKNKEITEFNNEVRNSAGQFVDLFAWTRHKKSTMCSQRVDVCDGRWRSVLIFVVFVKMKSEIFLKD